MQLKALSATGIKDFLQCELKIVLRYDRQIPSFKNDHAKVGIAVHEALEQFSRRILAKKSFPDPSDYDFALKIFMESAVREGLESMNFYTDGRKIVTEYIDRFDPSEKVLETEYSFKIETPDGVPIVGSIDKVVEINEDTLGIYDYKTARTALTNYELLTDIQLSMYDLAASIVWPQYKNRLLFLDYVRIDKKVSSYRTDQDRKTFREFLLAIWKQLNCLDEKEVKGRLNSLCGWCDYKNHCPEYSEFVNNKMLALKPLTDFTDEHFLLHWKEISDKKTILESRQRELKMIANQRFMKGEAIAASNLELYSTQAARTNYDIQDVVRILPQADLLDVLSVNKARLDQYAREHPDLKPALSKVATISYNAPVFKVRGVQVSEEIDESLGQDESAA